MDTMIKVRRSGVQIAPRQGSVAPPRTTPHFGLAVVRVGRGALAAMLLVAGLAVTAAPASAYHSKVSLANTVELRKGWWRTHIRVSHWTPNTRVTWRVCNPGYSKRGIVACDRAWVWAPDGYTDADGRGRARTFVYGGPVGDGRCDFQFTGCTIVVMNEPDGGPPDLASAVAVPIVLSS